MPKFFMPFVIVALGLGVIWLGLVEYKAKTHGYDEGVKTRLVCPEGLELAESRYAGMICVVRPKRVPVQ